jgi:hypothetical protein
MYSISVLHTVSFLLCPDISSDFLVWFSQLHLIFCVRGPKFLSSVAFLTVSIFLIAILTVSIFLIAIFSLICGHLFHSSPSLQSFKRDMSVFFMLSNVKFDYFSWMESNLSIVRIQSFYSLKLNKYGYRFKSCRLQRVTLPGRVLLHADSVDARVKSYAVHDTVLCGLRVQTACCVIGYQIITWG